MDLKHAGAVAASALLVFGLAGLAVISALRSSFSAATSIIGAVMTSDPDPRDQVPVSNARVSIRSTSAHAEAQTDASGFFSLDLVPGVRSGQSVSVTVEHGEYKPASLTVRVTDAPVLVWLDPNRPKTPRVTTPKTDQTVISDVRIRYTVKESSNVNAGTVAQTFEAVNTAAQPCKHDQPCSPDGRWLAGVGGLTLNAPEDGKFSNVRTSCIAGPCPFTRIEPVDLGESGHAMRISARTWSDTATFLVEADIYHTVISDIVRQSYPVIFGPSLSFTLPGTAAGPSIEAELNGQYIVFPLGPALHLSWADCSSKENPDHARLYSCELKTGYRFQ